LPLSGIRAPLPPWAVSLADACLPPRMSFNIFFFKKKKWKMQRAARRFRISLVR
jgi:hypothetical protein